MTLILRKTAGGLTLKDSPGGVRLLTGRGLLSAPPGPQGAQGPAGPWNGNEALATPAIGDRTPLRTAAGALRMARVELLASPGMDLPNLLPNDGALGAYANDIADNPGSFALPTSLLLINGTTASGSAGSHSYNSSTYGGTGAANPANVVDLMSAITTDNNTARYMPGFNLARIEMGAGTAGAHAFGGVTRYLAMQLGSVRISGPIHFSLWLRVNTGSVAARPLTLSSIHPLTLFRSGVEVTVDSLVLAPADGWVLVSANGLNLGAASTVAGTAFRAEPGTIFQFALPAVTRQHAAYVRRGFVSSQRVFP